MITMLLVKENLSLTVVLFVLAAPDRVKCADRAVHTELLTHLLGNYDNPYIPPIVDESQAVSVGFRFAPVMTILDETTQELQVRGMFLLRWEDDSLMWDETEYEGVLETTLPLFKDGVSEPTIWKPELVLYESLGIAYESFHPDTKTVTVKHTGEVYWYTLATVKSSCTVLVRYYPFDKQMCDLTFTTWLYQTNEQLFYAITDILENEAYKSYEVYNGLWDVWVDTVKVGNASYQCISCKGQEQSYVHYKLKMIRGQHWLYFFNLLLPCFVMSAMTLIVIWLPEKDVAAAATLGVTCILAFVVFLTFLFTQLPATGLPLIGDHIVWLIAEAAVVTVYAVYRATKEKGKELKKNNSSVDNNENHPADGGVPLRKEENKSGAESQGKTSQTPPVGGSNRKLSNSHHSNEQELEGNDREMVDKEKGESKVLDLEQPAPGDTDTDQKDPENMTSSPPQETSLDKATSKGSSSNEGDDLETSERTSETTDNDCGAPETQKNVQHQNVKEVKNSSSKRTSVDAPSEPNNAIDAENGASCGCSRKALKTTISDFSSSMLHTFQEYNALTKAMIFIKAATTIVFITILFIYIGS